MPEWISSSIRPSSPPVCRTTGAARGPCRGSGPPSSRPGWFVRSQNTSCTSTSCAACSSCRVGTLRAAFSTVSLAWNGERQQQIISIVWYIFWLSCTVQHFIHISIKMQLGKFGLNLQGNIRCLQGSNIQIIECTKVVRFHANPALQVALNDLDCWHSIFPCSVQAVQNDKFLNFGISHTHKYIFWLKQW